MQWYFTTRSDDQITTGMIPQGSKQVQELPGRHKRSYEIRLATNRAPKWTGRNSPAPMSRHLRLFILANFQLRAVSIKTWLILLFPMFHSVPVNSQNTFQMIVIINTWFIQSVYGLRFLRLFFTVYDILRLTVIYDFNPAWWTPDPDEADSQGVCPAVLSTETWKGFAASLKYLKLFCLSRIKLTTKQK